MRSYIGILEKKMESSVVVLRISPKNLNHEGQVNLMKREGLKPGVWGFRIVVSIFFSILPI